MACVVCSEQKPPPLGFRLNDVDTFIPRRSRGVRSGLVTISPLANLIESSGRATNRTALVTGNGESMMSSVPPQQPSLSSSHPPLRCSLRLRGL